MRGRGSQSPCKSHPSARGDCVLPAARINAGVLCVLQLAGIAVLAIGLWLRFDSQTKSIFEQETNNNNSSFYTGEGRGRLGEFRLREFRLWRQQSSSNLEAPVDPGTWAWEGLLLWPHWPVVSLSSCAVFVCVIVPVNLHLTDVVSFPDGQLGHVDGFLM